MGDNVRRIKLGWILFWTIIYWLIIVIVTEMVPKANGADLFPVHIWGAYSERTPNLPVDVEDYEFSGGIGHKKYQVSGLFERENGLYYRGGRALIIPADYLEIEWFMKEAQDIDNFSTRLFYKPFKDMWILDYLKTGISFNTQHWKEPRALIAMSYHLETKHDLSFTFSYENNFNDRTILFFKTGIKIPKGNFYIMPFTERREATGTRYYRQTKYTLGWEK